MSESSNNNFTSEEKTLLQAFWQRSPDRSHSTVTGVLVDDSSSWEDTFVLEEILLMNRSTDPLTIRAVSLQEQRDKIKNKFEALSLPEYGLDENSAITSEMLNVLLVRSDLFTYVNDAAILIEKISCNLLLNSLVADERVSQSIQNKIDYMSQQEREDWLYYSGVIDSGEKGSIRDVYALRNKIVHETSQKKLIEEIDTVPTAVDDVYDTVNLLHKKLYNFPIDYRLTDLLMDEPDTPW